MITINGEPFDLDTKVENEILHLRDVKREQAEQIRVYDEALTEANQDNYKNEQRWAKLHSQQAEQIQQQAKLLKYIDETEQRELDLQSEIAKDAEAIADWIQCHEDWQRQTAEQAEQITTLFKSRNKIEDDLTDALAESQRLKEKNNKCHATIGLLNSMVLCGERHTVTSETAVKEALKG